MSPEEIRREFVEYAIYSKESFIVELEELVASAERQIERHKKERGKAAASAAEFIAYLEKSFIPYQQETIRDCKLIIEKYRAELEQMNYSEAAGQVEFNF